MMPNNMKGHPETEIEHEEFGESIDEAIKKSPPMIKIKQSELKLLIEMGCRGRSLAWNVRNYTGDLKDGICVGMSISDVLACEDELNKILDDYTNMHAYD